VTKPKPQTRPAAGPRMVDRTTVRLIATKRLATGIVSLCAGVVGLGLFFGKAHANTTNATLLFVLFLLITFGGGAWSLRDGLRLRRELMRR
jgi:hypothetical protein